MRKLAIAASLVALVAATPALAEGRGGSSSYRPSHAWDGGGSFSRVFWGAWGQNFGQASHGRHFGWLHGKHWGWFKPHHPHWPHHPPVSP